LRDSIDHHEVFDQLKVAQELERHQLIEFRRISAHLYKKNARFAEAVTLSKKDKLYKDAMEFAAASKKQEIGEELLQFFAEMGSKECFASCLFTCYDIIRADVALEVAWRFKLLDYAFPFLVQFIREYTTKIDDVIKGIEEEKKKKEKKSDQPDSFKVSEDSSMLHTVPQLGFYDSGNNPGMQNFGNTGGNFGNTGGFGIPPTQTGFGQGGFGGF